jgi:hypothetical protein
VIAVIKTIMEVNDCRMIEQMYAARKDERKG